MPMLPLGRLDGVVHVHESPVIPLPFAVISPNSRIYVVELDTSGGSGQRGPARIVLHEPRGGIVSIVFLFFFVRMR